jgi:DNA-binding NarL/FixJ family response regulator
MKKPSPSPTKRPRLAIVDAQPACRIGLSHFIKKIGRWDIAWASATAEEAMEKLAKDLPDLLILEIELHGKDGLEFIKFLRPLYPELKILVHSAHSGEFYAERCIRAGASGYFHKMEPMGRFEKAVETVLSDHIFVNSHVAQMAVGTRHRGEDAHIHNLTDRELEILQLIAKGHSCQDTADKLRISPRTVQVHRNNIRLKIGLESALQLHAYAMRFCLGEEASSS